MVRYVNLGTMLMEDTSRRLRDYRGMDLRMVV